MKNLLLILLCLPIIGLGQCTPNSLYQDSTFGLWPDTIQNLPNAYTGTYYSTVIDIKTPALVSEVIDSSQAYVQGFYIGNNTVDSITLVNINGLPLGINLSCSSPNCTFSGNTVGCSNIFGTTNTIGQYPITFDINGWIHINIFGTNIAFDLYGATGNYQTISGYVLNVLPNFNISSITSNYNGFEVSCNGANDGNISLIVPNSNLYTCNWMGPNGFLSNLFNINNLFSGTYIYTITDTNGYSITDSITLNEPQNITINNSITNVSCYGGNDGQTSLFISGGVSPYFENWFGNNPSSLSAGTYPYNVIDNNGCSINNSIILTEPTQISITEIVVDISCYGGTGGQASLLISGGTPPYVENWYGQNPNNLTVGLFYYSIVDNNGCTVTDSVIIDQPDSTSGLTPLLITVSADTIYCNGGTSVVTAYVYGGVSPYTYVWSNNTSNQTALLTSGTHAIEITDDNGCSSLNTFNVYQLDSINMSVITTNTSCNGLNNGEIQINVVSGGITPFQYSINNGASFQSSNIFSSLSSSMYNVVIMDNNNCMASSQENISQPDELRAQAVYVAHVTCNGFDNGIAHATGTGGTVPYSFVWDSINGQTGGSAFSLTPGVHTVFLTDAKGCTTTDTVVITEPTVLFGQIYQNGSSLDVFANGGTQSYTFLWNTTDTIQQITPIANGTYWVIVEDINQCISDTVYFNVTWISTDITEYDILDLNIYPNPSDEVFNITFSSEKKQDIEIRIFNALGERVFVESKKSFFGRYSKQIDLEGYPKAIYFLEIETKNGIINKKLVIQ